MNHAQRRAQERYGLDLGLDDLWSIGQRVALGRSIMLARLHHGREQHLTEHDGRQVIVIWSRLTRQVITFLPRESQSWKFQKRAKQRRATRARLVAGPRA